MNDVPSGAAILLDFISTIETGKPAPDRYEVIYGHNQDKLEKPLTAMTLDEIEAAQPVWTNRFGSSAAGAYQFMRNTLDAPKTLRDIEGEMGLDGSELFDADLQDRMGFHLLKRRGYYEFVVGQLSMTAFGNRLAMEWASMPVLSAIKGAHRKLKRGQTYYAGDGVNKVLTKPEEVEAVLRKVLATRGTPAPTPAPRPSEAFPTRGAKDDPVVAQVQRRLIELGYNEVGQIDGDFGDFTEKAIILFRHDNGLPISGAIDEALLVALATAKPRAVSPARQEATPKEVREKVPEAKANWLSKVGAWWGMIVAAVAGVFDFLKDSLGEAKGYVDSIAGLFGAVPGWVWALLIVGALLFIYQRSKAGEAAATEAFRTGARR